jgi:hypothetical protein
MGKKEKPKKNEVHICSSCGREIIGDYEYIKTKRGTELYFCKDMRCRCGKNKRDTRTNYKQMCE